MAGSPPLVLACFRPHLVASGRPVGAAEGGGKRVAMSAAAKVAVVGCGISGAVCASMLARRGFSVTMFESGRGPGGRMSQRRELTENGELFFDHGAPFFTISNEEVIDVVDSWEGMGLVAQWKENLGCFDLNTAKFVDVEKDGQSQKYVGVPGMNSICKALCHEPGVETKFETTVGKIDWLEGRNLWLLSGLGGEHLGHFDSVVASDKNVFSSRYAGVTGRPPPLDITLIRELAARLQDVPVQSCFALMLAFSEPLSLIPVKGFSFKNSNVLSWAFCDSSKPGRFNASSISECWVLHSTAEYAAGVISKIGLKKPTTSTLVEVAEELFREFERTGLATSRPFFMKAHRWGSAFPATCVGGEAMCLWDQDKRLAVCGDFCASPSVEGAVISGMRAASRIVGLLSCS
uniref:Protoporphyrinogen oxidase, chloroplastic/mitochondrial n=2 Tax=Anthurium amnicola TaxID=1678845 RepID=A0A1D1YKJ4_9ARAE